MHMPEGQTGCHAQMKGQRGTCGGHGGGRAVQQPDQGRNPVQLQHGGLVGGAAGAQLRERPGGALHGGWLVRDGPRLRRRQVQQPAQQPRLSAVLQSGAVQRCSTGACIDHAQLSSCPVSPLC